MNGTKYKVVKDRTVYLLAHLHILYAPISCEQSLVTGYSLQVSGDQRELSPLRS